MSFSANAFFYLFIIFILGVAAHMYFQSTELKCIISDVDGKKYCVRERKKLHQAANLLATATQRCEKLVAHLKSKYPNDPRVQQLVANFNPRAISETLPTSEHTAYSENKGEQVAFCLNKRSATENEKLVDLNTLMFVALHELTHIMTSQEGHTQVYWQNFKFLLEQAKAIHIYNPVDYKQNPSSYCGMDISDNPLFDL